MTKILICEDDEAQANYLHALLANAGLHADIANTVAQAKNLIATNNYNVLLLDLILPDQDGITFIRQLRESEKTRDLPIIIISIITQAGKALLDTQALRIADWLEKPVNFRKLLEALARIKQNTQANLPG